MKKLLFAISLLLLSVTAQAATPTATSFTTTITAVSFSAIQLQGADSDGTPLTYTLLSSPGSGTLTNLNTSTGVVIYQPPNSTFTGTVSFTYKVTSGGEDSSAATVTIVVTNQKTRVVDKLINPNGAPKRGTVTFILARNNNDNTAYIGPSGLIPLTASESAVLDSQGKFDISVIPSRSMQPQAYYAVYYKDETGRITEPLGIFDIPATTAASVPLYAYKLTDTSKQARYLFASVAQIEALVQAVVQTTVSGVASFAGRSGAVTPSTNDYTWNQINKTVSSLADITTRSAADLNAGTLPVARGGTGLTSAPNNSAVVGDGSTWVAVTIPSCSNGTTDKLLFNSVTRQFSCGTDQIASGAGSGTVTSVGLSMPSQFTVTNSPVTASGTLTAAWASQAANRVLASPDGTSGVPTFRALTEADLPTIAATGKVSDSALSANVVRINANNTYGAFAQSFASATSLTLPSSPGVTPSASAQIAYDTTSNTLEVGVNGANKTVLMADGNGAGLTNLNASNLASGTVPVARGGTGLTSAPNNGALIGDGSNWITVTIPSCSNGTTDKLLYNNSTRTFTCGSDQSSGGSSTTPSIFNVRDYGAVCDDSTNDAAAFRSAVAALNSNGGGTLYVPGGTCKVQLGDPATDTNWSTLLDTRKGALVFTANNVHVKLDKNARIRVIATHIYQNPSGSGPPNYSALLAFNGASPLDQVEISGGRFTWETGGGAALTGTLNSENGWQFLRGGTKGLNIHDTTIDGFPQGGTNTGYTSGGFSLQDARIDNIRVLSYGGGGHDGFWYLQGRTQMSRSYITPGRAYYSHAFYSGADRPGTVIRNNTFEGYTQAADNKYPIQIYSESGGEIRDITIEGNEFSNCYIWFIAQKNDGATAVRNLKVIGNYGNGNYTASGFTSAYYAIEATRCHECLFQGNRINDYFQAMRLEFPQNTRIIGNSVNVAKFGILATAGQNVVIADNNVQGISVAGAYGIYFSGNKMSVDNNTVVVSSNRTGIYGIGGSGLGDYRVTNNTVTGDGVAFTTSGTITDLVVSGNQFDMTTGQPMQFPFGATCNGCVVSNNTIKTGSTLDPGAFLIDSNTGTFHLENNKLSVGNIYWNATTVIPTNNQILTGQFSNTTGVVRGRGNMIGGRIDTNVANSGASYTPFVGLYPNHLITLTANTTIANATGATEGDTLTLTLVQDATGGRTVTWGGEYTVSCTITSAANAQTSLQFRRLGSTWVQLGACSSVTGGGGGGGIADPGSNGILARTALNTTAARTITGTSNKITVTNGDGVSGNPTLTVGSDVVETTKANTFGAFAQSFASSTSLTLPVAAGAAPTASAQIAYDSTSNTLEVGVNGANKTVLMADGSGASLTALNASQLTSGTVPDARFPATLPAVSGVNLTALNASNITSGTMVKARMASTVFHTDQSNAISFGDQDFGLADSLTVPKFTTYLPTTNGRLGYDNTDNVYRVAQGASTRTIVTTTDTSGAVLNAQIGASAAIALTKLASISTNTVLGRISASTGAIEQLTGSNVRTITGLATTDSPTFAGVTLGANGLTASGSSNGYTGVNVSTSSGTVVANYQGPTGVEYRLKYTTAATDEQYWRIAVGSNYLGYEAVKTDNSGANTAFRVVRLAHVPTYFEVPVAKLNVATTGNGSAQSVLTSASTSLMPLYVYTPASPSVPIAQFAVAGATRFTIENDGGFSSSGVTFANLGAPSNGKFIFCSDCTIANPCASGGSGALAKRLNGAWVCN